MAVLAATLVAFWATSDQREAVGYFNGGAPGAVRGLSPLARRLGVGSAASDQAASGAGWLGDAALDADNVHPWSNRSCSSVHSAPPAERICCNTACNISTYFVNHGLNCTLDDGSPDCSCSTETQGLINYLAFQTCTMENSGGGYVLMAIWLMYMIFLLGDTADEFFCPSLQSTVTIMKLSPNVAGVTFLSFGNGAPDVFSALVAGDLPSLMISALVGAGIFVTTVVVGAVALTCPDSELNRRPFLRDVIFYTCSTVYLFVVFRDNTVSLGESIGFLGIYVLFALVVIVGRIIYQKYMKPARADAPGTGLLDAAGGGGGGGTAGGAGGAGDAGESYSPRIMKMRSQSHGSLVSLMRGAKRSNHGLLPGPPRGESQQIQRPRPHRSFDVQHGLDHDHHFFKRRKHWTLAYMAALSGDDIDELVRRVDASLRGRPTDVDTMQLESLTTSESQYGSRTVIQGWIKEFREQSWYSKLLYVARGPADLARRMTIPLIDEDMWSYPFAVANPICGVTLFAYLAAPDFFGAVGFLGPVCWYQLALGVGAVGTLLAWWLAPRDRPPEGWVLVVWLLFSFLMSVVWILLVADEVVGLLYTFGIILKIPETVLGLTVLAWGNSLGDLVADVTVAKEGMPAMAIAGTFAGPMFNMLMGLGLSLTKRLLTSTEPVTLTSHDENTNVVDLMFLTLLLSLVVSVTVVPLTKFRMKRWYGILLIVIYVAFLVLAVAVVLNPHFLNFGWK